MNILQTRQHPYFFHISFFSNCYKETLCLNPVLYAISLASCQLQTLLQPFSPNLQWLLAACNEVVMITSIVTILPLACLLLFHWCASQQTYLHCHVTMHIATATVLYLNVNILKLHMYANFRPVEQCFSTAGPWHQLYWAVRGSPGIFHE
jgi:hypothetical protein